MGITDAVKSRSLQIEAQVTFFSVNLYACLCILLYVALDAASKAADVSIQGVERNRLKAGACVKMRGDISSVNAAMDVAVATASRLGKVTANTIIASPSEGTEIAMEMTINK